MHTSLHAHHEHIVEVGLGEVLFVDLDQVVRLVDVAEVVLLAKVEELVGFVQVLDGELRDVAEADLLVFEMVPVGVTIPLGDGCHLGSFVGKEVEEVPLGIVFDEE